MLGNRYLYTVQDRQAEYYLTPFFARNDMVATRMFETEANNPDGQIGSYPEHFILWRLGEYDESKGIITPEAPLCVAKAHELVRRYADQPPEMLDE